MAEKAVPMGYRVLVVDDSKLARMAVAKALSALHPDWTRVEAASHRAATAAVAVATAAAVAVATSGPSARCSARHARAVARRLVCRSDRAARSPSTAAIASGPSLAATTDRASDLRSEPGVHRRAFFLPAACDPFADLDANRTDT